MKRRDFFKYGSLLSLFGLGGSRSSWAADMVEPYEIRFRDPVSNIVNSRPVCNQKGLPSTQATNCEKTSENKIPSELNPQGTALIVELKEGDVILEQSLPLDPSGVVYDSLTRKPVGGAKVKLIAPAGFNPSTHLIGGLGSPEQTVGPLGFYQNILTAIVGCQDYYDAGKKTAEEKTALQKAMGVRAVDVTTIEFKLTDPQPARQARCTDGHRNGDDPAKNQKKSQ